MFKQFLRVVPCVIVIWNLSKDSSKISTYIKYAIIISAFISCLYGVILTKLEGLNPYSLLVSSHFVSGSGETNLIYALQESRVGFSTAGKIQSTTDHPMLWGLMLCSFLIIFTVYYQRKELNRVLLFGLILLVVFNMLVSGVRSCIAATICGFVYYMIASKRAKLLFATLFVFFVVYLIILQNSDLYNLFISFVDFNNQKSDVSGSSISMRMDQLSGAFSEIKNNILFGNGYGWVTYYLDLYGGHPVLLAFESSIFVILCNSGFVGLLIWTIFYLLLFRFNRKILRKEDLLIINSYIITYISYTVITGEYGGYFSLFSLIYSFLIGYFYQRKIR